MALRLKGAAVAFAPMAASLQQYRAQPVLCERQPLIDQHGVRSHGLQQLIWIRERQRCAGNPSRSGGLVPLRKAPCHRHARASTPPGASAAPS